MEGLVAFLAIVAMIVFVIIPIVLLVKMNQLSSKMSDWEFSFRQMRDELGKLSAIVQGLKTGIAHDAIAEIKPEQKTTEIQEDIIQEKTVQEEPEQELSEVSLYTEQEEEPASTLVEAVSLQSLQETGRVGAMATSVNVSENIDISSSEKVEKDNNNLKYWVGKLLGDNWLTKVGVITLVLGIAFFVKYAIDQNWINEVGRVGIGILTGGIIIGIAHKLRKKYRLFAALLTGGGIAVFYITITIAFREYQLFSQSVAFVLLIIVTLFSVALSLLYNHRELAVFSLLGGFAAPLLASTGTGNYVVLFSYILILNAGMLAVSFRKRWQIIGMICYVLTLIFFWTWLIGSYQHQYRGATLFAVLFFVQFYALALIAHFKSDKQITVYQVLLILSNNLSLLLACTYIFNDYPLNIRGLIVVSMAVVNAIVLFALFRNATIDRKLIYLIIAIVASLATLAVPVQLHGHVITLFWAAETVILLWLWQKSHIRVCYTGFLILSALVLVSYGMDLLYHYGGTAQLAVVLNPVCITGLVVVACFAIDAFLLGKEQQDALAGVPFRLVRKIFRVLTAVLLFAVPAFELNYQLVRFTDIHDFVSFRYAAMATYTCLYGLALAVVYSKQMPARRAYLYCLLAGIILYAIVYQLFTIGLRADIFLNRAYPAFYFWVHLLSLPAIVYAAYLLIRHINALPKDEIQGVGWILAVFMVAVISLEADHLAVLLTNGTNYHTLLFNMHTFGYPMLWGVVAMILMIWGLNRKEVLLRKIALLFFGVIIVKFYAYDVWNMSQTGRIISFVLLGVILLLVSFLQQKIKVLVKKDETEEQQGEQ